MRAKQLIIVTVIALLTMAIAFGVSAQDNSGGSNGQTSGQQGSNGQGNIGFNSLATNGQQAGLFPSGQGNSFFTGLNGAMPRNASLLGVAFLDGFTTYTFDLNSLFGTQITAQTQTNLNNQNQANLNTQNQNNFNTQGQNNGQNNGQTTGQNTAQNNATFANLQQCGNVRVYKLSPEGVQDLWPNVSCNGSLLSVQAGGRGHYIMYRFNGNNSAVNAPVALYPCTTQATLNANFGTQAGTQAQQGNVVCVSAQGSTFGTQAGQGTTQGQTNLNNQNTTTSQNNTTNNNNNGGTTGTGTGNDSTTGTGSDTTGNDSTTGTGTGTGNG